MKRLLIGLTVGILALSLLGCGTQQVRTDALETFGQAEANPAESLTAEWPNAIPATTSDGTEVAGFTAAGRNELMAARTVCEYNMQAVEINARLYEQAVIERNGLVRILQAQQFEAEVLRKDSQSRMYDNWLLRGLNVIMAVAIAL